ncbi:hypothetical protein BCR35DRAFT_355710 [Leucosporidium creatinivorum]|uniref:Uncharacterized protein n=1 Tax=Leucosporidium creatinivorum TaxID=106004 RepID=A0A1Y2D905_9BASI|nr:hypothetical protein BCR35DRAFT_355710 [Leucosporidium creatinivorum]
MASSPSPSTYISFADQFKSAEGSMDIDSWLSDSDEGSTIDFDSSSMCTTPTDADQLFNFDLLNPEADNLTYTTPVDSLLFAEDDDLLPSPPTTRGYLDYPLPAQPTTVTSKLKSTASWIAKQFAREMTDEEVLAMSWGPSPVLSDAECGWSESCGSESECSSESSPSSDASSSSSSSSFVSCPSTPSRSSTSSKVKRTRNSPTSSTRSRRTLADKLIHPSPIPPRQREAAESRKRSSRSELGDGERPSALSWPLPAPLEKDIGSSSWIESQLPAPLQLTQRAIEKAKYEQQAKLDRWFEGLSAESIEHLVLWERWVEEAGKVYTPAEVQTVLLELEARGLLEVGGGARGVARSELKRIAGERESWLW